MSHHVENARPGKIEEFIQVIRFGKKMKKPKHIKKTKKDNPGNAWGHKKRHYEFETKLGVIFSLTFHPGAEENPSCRMRLEIIDPEVPEVPDPAYDPARPKMVFKMRDIRLWTPEEIMRFMIEYLKAPDQENWDQIFGPEPVIANNIDSDGNSERVLKSESKTETDLTSDAVKDFFTA
jgi:hypothetical protein